MFEFCFTINGQRHCFRVPAMIDRSVIKVPPPNNYPPFELAAAVLLLVEAAPHSELAKQLTGVANSFIHQVQAGLPKGVELHRAQAGQTVAG